VRIVTYVHSASALPPPPAAVAAGSRPPRRSILQSRPFTPRSATLQNQNRHYSLDSTHSFVAYKSKPSDADKTRHRAATTVCEPFSVQSLESTQGGRVFTPPR